MKNLIEQGYSLPAEREMVLRCSCLRHREIDCGTDRKKNYEVADVHHHCRRWRMFQELTTWTNMVSEIIERMTNEPMGLPPR